MIAAMVIFFVVILIIGGPIFLCLGGAALAPYLVDSTFKASGDFLTRLMVGGANSTVMLAIPMFVLAGVIMGVGGISEKIFNFFAFFVGKRPAGIPCAVILTSIIYGAICGAGGPAAAAVGAMAIPIMTRLGYDRKFSAGMVAAGGGIGLIIPPSLGYVIYGSLTGTSVGAIFVAGFLPGILIGICLMVYAGFFCRKNGVDQAKLDANFYELRKKGFWKVFKDSFFALLSPVIILGCIYGGLTTPTEAAVISVWYSLIICVFIYRTIRVKELIRLLREGLAGYAGIATIIAFSTSLTRVFEMLNMPAKIGAFMTATFSQSWSMLLAVIFVLLIIGMFMDVMPSMIIFSPLLYPIVVGMYGVNAVHFGIILTSTVALGLITPPYGLNIFVSAAIADVEPGKMFKQCIAVSICYFIAMMFITYIPAISLFLPRLLNFAV